ncbi:MULTISPECIES: SDR family oxidoreductase [Streptomyces]|uniref:NAD(P)H-binding protein n=2 Tax=Streptomyces nigrescens TaxID=1920 RepID=A0A640TDG1_STRNI|nr:MULTISPECIES: NAD(P)H-binding protein [Streptomyces]WAT96074.1 NAD(P)H-binding protein [Streptomyces libani subsp. libani]WAU03696.1 NAD(P)H-binding protein [Streptomyces nigrescens]WDT58202.1 NAD(P)H-binding protein [Streptomyces sp. G7(2002)]GFE21398.1 NmrA family transcriptional regulator [Streptomyces libani subsp. libani]GGW02338.1 NmrA family transcriptional regulator [Streptomyces libani subsp. libani]
MILVTGATGNIGRALLEELRACGAGPVRGLTRDAARVTFPEGVEAVEGDLGRAGSLNSALNGVRSLFLVQGMGAESEVLEAARQAGVEHVVLVSSITVQTHPHLPAAGVNAAVERLLKDSGMAWTILRPTQFASNTLWWATSIREHGTVHVPYADLGLPTIHPADIAAVARAALVEPGHRGRTYPLTGPERVTARQQVAALAAALGQELSLVGISREQAHRQMASFMGDETANAVLDLMGGDLNEELLKVRDTVPQLTGRPATPFRQWATEHAAAFR